MPENCVRCPRGVRPAQFARLRTICPIAAAACGAAGVREGRMSQGRAGDRPIRAEQFGELRAAAVQRDGPRHPLPV